jgi:hypothetical protein
MSTVGAGAESRVFARNIDISIGGVDISPVSDDEISCVAVRCNSSIGRHHLL